MRYELELTVSGMDKTMMDRLYEFLDNNEYSYVGHENTYEEREAEEELHMTFEEYIKQMSHKDEAMRLINSLSCYGKVRMS